MTRVSIEMAQSDLPDLIARLAPGEGLQITKDGRPIARLVAEGPRPVGPRKPGSAVGELIIVEEDWCLSEGYRQMAQEEAREAEASEWVEATFGAIADEAR